MCTSIGVGGAVVYSVHLYRGRGLWYTVYTSVGVGGLWYTVFTSIGVGGLWYTVYTSIGVGGAVVYSVHLYRGRGSCVIQCTPL